ncbi:tRNA (adenosine(37)-N6)-threonylcarbamoyltransferase complex transferase subunit TsaD [Fusibacter ferrireducens]|uniref:tRNA N6-adenosine threonylcarbamoyltransferase n=1 Tax=Fusibacter ferrireducens TaxID=2785058 RepID=A0ABR9ZVK1_9FIRM|nr:tRNA (adenosine(37)-N6)-threonylcarbamoyltransferase complex transferase subunit TsaD [Fusibacter ferrireducens]MBF4694484.1 tRNA (adenosine(37)-N6)-threonylcarbamoyltransferase complex transferase subunit TsaD [Fusibacter ferrireducens]
MNKRLITLAIETSCDETSCAILSAGRTILANEIYTQIEIHKAFGGVVPEVASRNHLEKISWIIDDSLKTAGIGFEEVDHIAVTYGPGLVGALLVGLSSAKALAYALEIPFVPVNHIEGHIAANYIAHPELEPPFVCLVVSGGHTHLVEVKDYTTFEVIGKTRDDAAGEAFDKVARTLGLGYPGGPLIDQIAKSGNPYAIDFPKAMLDQENLDFSFSGLKSAVLNYINSCKMKKIEINIPDVCASFQEAVVHILCHKAMDAIEQSGHKKMVLAGGVAANTALRETLSIKCNEKGVGFYYPPLALCTDNAAMIGCAGYYNFRAGYLGDMSVNAIPNLRIGTKMGL